MSNYGYETIASQQKVLIAKPVVSGDASSTRPSGLFVLLIVVDINMGLLSLLLQDLSKLVFANAAKIRAHVVGFLDDPLRTATPPVISSINRRYRLSPDVRFKGAEV